MVSTLTLLSLNITEANWWKEGVVITELMYHPNFPVYNPDGSYALGASILENNYGVTTIARIENPVALANEADNYLDHLRLLGILILKWD